MSTFFTALIFLCLSHFEGAGQLRDASKILVGNPEGGRSLWRTNRRWEDNIKVDFIRMVLGEIVD